MLLFNDGFDGYSKSGQLALKPGWSLPAGGSIVPGRAGSALKFDTVILTPGVDVASPILGIAFCPITDSSSPGMNVTFLDSKGNTQFYVTIARSTRAITIYRYDGAILESITNAFTDLEFFYVEIKATISASSGSVGIYLNGSSTAALSVTGVATRHSSSTENSFRSIRFNPNGSFTMAGIIDDLYLCDTTGSSNNNLLGDVRIDTLRPNGMGATNTFDEIGSQAFRDAAHAYWRLVCYDSYGRQIPEIEMRATIGGADQCSGGTSSASFGSATNAFDNDMGTYTQIPTADTVWIQYQFASPVVVKELAIGNMGYPDRDLLEFALFASDDGASFTQVLAVERAYVAGLGGTLSSFPIPAMSQHYALVNSPGTPSVGFLSSMTNGAKELFALTDPSPVISGNIKAVVVHNAVRKATPGLAKCRNVVRSGTTEGAGSTVYAATSITNISTAYETNPATGNPWTPTEINSMQAGLECVA